MADADNIIRAFSIDQVVKLTGLSKGQLTYWDNTGFFRPQYAFEDRRMPNSRVYSFRDVVSLKTLAILRKEYGVSLQHLRDVAVKLSHLKEALWIETTLYVLNKRVYFNEPETGKVRDIVSGQYAVRIPLVRIMKDMSADVEKLKCRPLSRIGFVERHRRTARNAWVVAGTRIPTKAIVEFVKAGYSIEEIMREYPSLTESDIAAAIKHEEEVAAQRA